MDTPTRERLEQLEARLEKLEARIVDLERLKVVDHRFSEGAAAQFSEGAAAQFREIKDSIANRGTPAVSTLVTETGSVVSPLVTGSDP